MHLWYPGYSAKILNTIIRSFHDRWYLVPILSYPTTIWVSNHTMTIEVIILNLIIYVKVFCFRILFLFLISFVFRGIIMRDAYLLTIFYTNYFLVYDMLNISSLSLSLVFKKIMKVLITKSHYGSTSLLIVDNSPP